MCGNDGNIRIEPADNGMTIDAYTPGGEGRPGSHRKLVAANADHALRLLKPHLAKIGKKAGRGRGKGRGHVELGGDGPAPAKGRKRTARKRA